MLRFLLLCLICIAIVIPGEHVAGQCDASDQIVMLASVDNPTPFVGEQIIYTVRIENSTSSSPVPESPAFEGFWLGGALDVRREQACQGAVGVTITEKVLFPLDAGVTVIAPGNLDFSSNPVYEASTRVVSEEVVVDVQPLPPGAPSAFNGAVGGFASLTARADTTTVEAGTPFSFQVRVEGVGNIEQLDAPELPLPPDWRIYPQQSRTNLNISVPGRTLGGERVFEWLIIPSDPGNVSVPPIDFSYFDPTSATYQTLTTNAVPIAVVPPTNPPVEAAEAVGQPTIANWSLKAGSGAPGNLPWVSLIWLWFLPPIAVVGAFGFRWYWHFQQSIRVRRQRENALKTARGRLAKVTRMQGDVAYRAFVQAVLMYFGDKWNENHRMLDMVTIEAKLQGSDVDPELVNELLVCVAQAYEQRYAPSEALPLGPLIRSTLDVLSDLDHMLEAEYG